jgi:Arc/MetJ family transcription regulator
MTLDLARAEPVPWCRFVRCGDPEHTTMRTNIEIDDELMRQVLSASGLRTKRAAVEEGLRLLLRLKQQEQIKTAFGRLPWDGDLDAMRRGRRRTRR